MFKITAETISSRRTEFHLFLADTLLLLGGKFGTLAFTG